MDISRHGHSVLGVLEIEDIEDPRVLEDLLFLLLFCFVQDHDRHLVLEGDVLAACTQLQVFEDVAARGQPDYAQRHLLKRLLHQ